MKRKLKRKYNFPENLSDLLEKRNILQNQLAKAIGKAQGSISKYCSGDKGPKLEAVIKIANYFEISLDALVLGEQ